MDIATLYDLYLAHPTICTDTRRITEGAIYFALKGENFNGNAFAVDALAQGCAYAIVDEIEETGTDDRLILVDDVLSSLQALASHHRKQLDIPVIGITGSNGKTTSKELIRDVLAKRYKVLATLGNLNNHIGVPLTLLSITAEHEIAIIEMGANHVGEIEMLSALARPTHGMITNIGRAHIGEFGGYDNIIKGKTELYTQLRNTDGVVFVNADDHLLLGKATDIDMITYGASAIADHQGRIAATDPTLRIELKPDDRPVQTHLVGDYNFANLMAAACIGDHFQLSEEDIIAGLEAYRPDNNRSQLIEREGKRFVMDAYNANPTSMEAAIENFARMRGAKKLAILGAMKELGEETEEAHQKLVANCEKHAIDCLLIGTEFVEAIGDERCFATTAEAKKKTEELVSAADLVLVKGSRSIGLERLFE